MPEYFIISLISKHQGKNSLVSECLADRFNLHEGENSFVNSKYTLLNNKKIICGIFEYENCDFDEYCISFPEWKFHEKSFKNEIALFTTFIDDCFEVCKDIEFALCSYEINGYLLGKINQFNDLNAQFLLQFPIVYSRQKNTTKPLLTLNLDAQDIFTLYPIQFDEPVP